MQKERGQFPTIDVAFVPTMCNHCDNAPCIKADPSGAIRKRDDGIVIIDPARAEGRKDLVEACPNGHIWWNDELKVPQAWPFDAHLLDRGWTKTRGHQACPTGAMQAIKVDDEEMARIAQTENLEVMHPELNAKPRVYYKNLWRYSKCFIAGTVSALIGNVVECLEGVPINLSKDGKKLATTTTDNYGDFKFDRLEQASGGYVIEISYEGKSKMIEVTLGESINVGEISFCE